MMQRTRLPAKALRAWALLNGVELNGVEITELQNGHGCGIIAIRDMQDEDTVFVRVPRELVLSKELVWEYARSDPDLRQVLEGMGDWATITASSAEVTDRIGLPNPFFDYVKFLPDERGVPSRWSEHELECLWGTSLQNHIAVKQHSLETLFADLRKATENIAWCAKWWWNETTGVLTLDDFKEVDSMFRSRAMDFGEQGQSLVPVMDMANHDHGDRNNALYEIDRSSGNALLVMHTGRSVRKGCEVTINYGSDRSASDLLHAYGFIEDMPHAGSMFVSFPRDFAPFEADPLASAKYVGFKLVPGVKFYISDGDRIRFHSPFVYAMSVNEEDGLGWDVAQTIDGDREFQLLFHDVPVNDAEELVSKLREDRLWDLFQWRAHAYLTILLEGVKREVEQLNLRPLKQKLPEGITPESSVWQVSEKLRQLEYRLIQMVLEDFEHRLDHLQNSHAVIMWSKGESEADGGEGASAVSSSLRLGSEEDTGFADAAEQDSAERQAQEAQSPETWEAPTSSTAPSQEQDDSILPEAATDAAAHAVNDREQYEPADGAHGPGIQATREDGGQERELPIRDARVDNDSSLEAGGESGEKADHE